jgi:MFS family permease
MHVELVTSNAGSTTSANLDQNLPTNSSWRCTAAVVIAALGALQAGFSVAMTSPIAPQVISQTDIDLDQWSTIVAVLQLGGALGSLIEGMLAYKIGSLNLMTLSNFPVIIGYLLMLSFENFSCFLVSRICK